jgi:para-aminobenzoate synthetase component 1
MTDIDDLKHPVIISLAYIEPSHVFGLLGGDDFVYLGGGRYQVVSLCHERIGWNTILDQVFEDHSKEYTFDVFQLGFIGAIPYREPDEGLKEGVVFKVSASLVWDSELRKCFLVYSRNLRHEKWMRVLSLVENLKKISNSRNKAIRVEPVESKIDLRASRDDDDYMGHVGESIEDIHNGRFYQINLLRYFDIEQSLPEEVLFSKILHKGGPFTAFIQFGEERLVSFSPERFIKIESEDGRAMVEMQPIKGSMKRSGDCDEEEKFALLNSKKDLAELSIIIDLARNDLYSIAKKHSVEVKKAGEIKSYPTIHHLVAAVRAELKSRLRFRDIFEGILPAASITGAPKKEVTLAIRAREQRPRDYFMGHIFYWDPGSAIFDSSVLIRTLHGKKKDGEWRYEYAAGSGIVADSDPVIEMNEVESKTKVLTGEGCLV